MEDIHAKYSKRKDSTLWDPVHVQYPLRRFPRTEESSETRCHQWKGQLEVLTEPQKISDEEKQYSRDHSCLADLNRSVTTMHFGSKREEGGDGRFSKHTGVAGNQYLYPVSRKLEERPPLPRAHGTSEMRSSYKDTAAPGLVRVEHQVRYPPTAPANTDSFAEPSWEPIPNPLDTTHEGFVKHLDPYLTTSRLHHRPFTADQLARPSNTHDIVTYYTFSTEPWVRKPNPGAKDWWLPLKLPKKMYDREKFKQDQREIVVHNKLAWTPGAFSTEVQDNFVNPKNRPQSSIHNFEENTRCYYLRHASKLKCNEAGEDSVMKAFYDTESRHVGSGRQLCSAVDQHKAKSRRLQK